MLKLPFPITDALKLADWLELYAILSEDHNSSYIDLERAIRREGIFADDDIMIELLIQKVSYELYLRSVAACEAYPFGLEERKIYLRNRIENFIPYVFCLCISFFERYETLNRNPYPRRMFEYLCCEAAKNFVGGEVVRFGFPRNHKEISREFQHAIDDICKLIGEGVGFRGTSSRNRKDDGIDVIAWRNFPDLMEGKLLLLGNCASGNSFDDKLDELQPIAFCRNWMIEIPASFMNSIRAFFVPRRIPRDDWSRISSRAGIIFDRCRIAFWTSKTTDFYNKESYLRWCKRVLEAQGS